MRILFSLDKFLKSEGGADALAKGIVQALVSLGHEVRVVQVGRSGEVEAEGYSVKSYPLKRHPVIKDGDFTTICWNSKWENIIKKEIIKFSPHLVLTQNMLVPASVKAAIEEGIKSAILFHGYRCVSPSFFYQEDALKSHVPGFLKVALKDKLKWPLISKTLKLYKEAYSEATMTIANSKYSANVLERFFGRKSEVLYPVLDMKLYNKEINKTYDGAILFVKPQKIKGVEVLFSIAKKLKEKKFIVVGNANKRIAARLKKYPNIDYRSWVDDMDSVYSECSVIFGPSQIPEPFGRVFLEAGMRGIPSVASNWGGIPDAVGDGGILPDFNSSADKWINALFDVCSKENFSLFSVEARKNAEKIFSTHTTDYLQTIICKI